MLVILDTSTVLAHLLSRGKSHTRNNIRLAKLKKISLAVSDETLQELKKKIRTEKIKKSRNYNSRHVGIFIAWYIYNNRFFNNSRQEEINPVLRDQKDSIFLHLARKSDADYLITLDQDLLILKTIDKTKIVTPETFINSEFPDLL